MNVGVVTLSTKHDVCIDRRIERASSPPVQVKLEVSWAYNAGVGKGRATPTAPHTRHSVELPGYAS